LNLIILFIAVAVLVDRLMMVLDDEQKVAIATMREEKIFP